MLIIKEDMTNLLSLAIESGVKKEEDPMTGRLRLLAMYWVENFTPMELALVMGTIPDTGVDEGWAKVKAMYRARLAKLVGENHGKDTDSEVGSTDDRGGAGAGGAGAGESRVPSGDTAGE